MRNEKNCVNNLAKEEFVEPIKIESSVISIEYVNNIIESEKLEISKSNGSEKKKEAKRIEDRLKDKIALAAREKLGLLSKEKQLQLERKKKAMEFLNQLRGSGVKIAPQESDEKIVINSDSEGSVHSIPSSPTYERSHVVENKHQSRTKSRSRSRSHSRTR